ncbi:MAG TPA: DNA polymerase III subunit delta [Clostridia bacterium]|nr:DNA polymerase III subunit delta [Clostridia bacterium]
MGYRQLMNDIKNNCIKPVYLIFGNETYLIDKGREALKNAVVTSFPELNYTRLEGEKLEADELSAACRTFPFGTEKRLVEVRNPEILRSKGRGREEDENGDEDEKASAPGKDAQPFIDVLQNLDDTVCLLLLSYGGINKKRKKLLDEVKKHGAVLEFNRIERDELAQWIKKVLGKSGKNISTKELNHFINITGYLDKNGSKTLYDIENEIKKLTGFMGNSTEVTLEHIEAIVPRNIENDIFKLINACYEKDADRSLRIYNDLLLEGETTVGVLALLSSQVKNMLKVYELYEKKYDRRSISEKLKLHEYTVKLCIQYGSSIKRQALQSAFRKCLDTDLSIKSGGMGDRLAMEMLLAGLFE